MPPVSDNSCVTQDQPLEQNCLRELSRYLRMRRKFWDQFNRSGFYLIDFLITQAVADCNHAGFSEKAREIISNAEFENASLPQTRQLEQNELKELFLSRLERLARLLKQGERFIGAEKRQAILERALDSTFADLSDLGLESLAIETILLVKPDSPTRSNKKTLAHK